MNNPATETDKQNKSKSSSFYYSFLYLNSNQKKAINALYDFCRRVDDAVDNIDDKRAAHKVIEWWRDEINKLYQGHASHPTTKALLNAIENYNLKQEYFIDIINGMEMDLDIHYYQTFDDLKLYCYRAAGAVGLLSIPIFGYQHKETEDFAKYLGRSLQLINIIRDIGEDADRGRIYIPEEDLDNFHVNVQDIHNKVHNKNFINLMNFQAQRALDYYDKALDLLPESDRYYQKSSLIMASIYKDLLNEIMKDNYLILDRKYHLTTIRKFWIALTTARRENKRYKLWIKNASLS